MEMHFAEVSDLFSIIANFPRSNRTKKFLNLNLLSLFIKENLISATK